VFDPPRVPVTRRIVTGAREMSPFSSNAKSPRNPSRTRVRKSSWMTGYAFYDNEYRWELSGSTLTLTTVKNDCPDRVAETILTSRPWTKQ
jgi:hypothetical protein